MPTSTSEGCRRQAASRASAPGEPGCSAGRVHPGWRSSRGANKEAVGAFYLGRMDTDLGCGSIFGEGQAMRKRWFGAIGGGAMIVLGLSAEAAATPVSL